MEMLPSCAIAGTSVKASPPKNVARNAMARPRRATALRTKRRRENGSNKVRTLPFAPHAGPEGKLGSPYRRVNGVNACFGELALTQTSRRRNVRAIVGGANLQARSNPG